MSDFKKLISSRKEILQSEIKKTEQYYIELKGALREVLQIEKNMEDTTTSVEETTPVVESPVEETPSNS